MVADYGLELLPGIEVFAEDVAPTKSGVAEIVIPDSNVIGKSARDLLLRQTYRQSLLAIHRAAMCSAMKPGTRIQSRWHYPPAGAYHSRAPDVRDSPSASSIRRSHGKRIIPIVSGVVGLISSFMQNGAAALFLPVVSRISARTKIPLTAY